MTAAAVPAIELPSDDTTISVAVDLYVKLGFMPIPLYGFANNRCTCSNIDCPEKAWGKHPRGKEWETRASSDPDRARELFRGHRGNIGLMMGRSFIAIDVDGPTGYESLEQLGPLPDTLTAQSGSGIGEHRIFRYQPLQDPDRVPNRTALPKLDIKTRNGQIVVAPSLHRSGNRYRWTRAIPPALLPQRAFDRLTEDVATVAQLPTATMPANPDALMRRASAYLASIPPAISGSGGHSQTFAAARAIVAWIDKGLPQHDGWSLLCEYNQRCDPPWSKKELEHKWHQALEKAHTVPQIEDRPNPHAGSSHASNPHAATVAAAPSAAAASADTLWKQRLVWENTTKGQRPAKHAENAIVVLRYHPDWQGKVRLDTHSRRVVVIDAPWHESDRPDTPDCERDWTDKDSVRLSAWIKRELYVDISIEACDRAVEVAAESNSFHPVRDYFDSLRWDQSPRLTTAPARYFGAQQTEYTALVFRWWMIAAVARTYFPGIKMDNVLILEGPQGLKKSSALRTLTGAQWFSDTPIDLHSKDAYSALNGKLVVELAELESLRRADASRAKSFFTSSVDYYRPPYGKREIMVPRGCVFAGTVNHASYLQDSTGNRRYWPVACTAIDLAAIAADRDQLWAEAVHWRREGARWWPETAEEVATCEREQAPRAEGDEWEAKIATYLHARPAATPTVGELLEDALGVKPGDWNRADQMRVSSVLLRLGYEKFREPSPPRTWRYRVRTKASA